MSTLGHNAAIDHQTTIALEIENMPDAQRSELLLGVWSEFYRQHPVAAAAVLRLATEYNVPFDTAARLATIGLHIERGATTLEYIEASFALPDASRATAQG